MSETTKTTDISIEVEKDQYATEDLAENYRLFLKSRESELRYVQIPSIRKLLGGSLRGKRVVDLACGNGGSTRILADLEPDELVGVDLSPEQIKMAEKMSSQNEKYAKIKYLVLDCTQPLGLGQFDVVFSKHLLNYANSIETLKNMACTMFDATKPGQLCTGMMFNPAFKIEDAEKMHKYGLDISKPNPVELFMKLYDGHIKSSRYLMNLRVFMWPPEEFEKAFAEAGFMDFEWVRLHLEGDDESDTKHLFHSDFVDYDALTLFKAVRPN